MVLAAGFGTRMRPLSLQKPKPLFEVGGRAMLDHALDHLVKAGIERAIVNVHYLGEQIAAHLASRKDIEIVISRENEILDTGGGIKNVLPQFGGQPFYALNADLPWIDAGTPSLKRMREFWDAERMDALLLLMPTQKAPGFAAHGDFYCDKKGHVWRRNAPTPRPYVWISAQILSPMLFADTPQVFSNNLVWDKSEAQGRLYGVVHEGTCYHVGTPQDLERANALLASSAGWAV